jgi:hypothetical protein
MDTKKYMWKRMEDCGCRVIPLFKSVASVSFIEFGVHSCSGGPASGPRYLPITRGSAVDDVHCPSSFILFDPIVTTYLLILHPCTLVSLRSSCPSRAQR